MPKVLVVAQCEDLVKWEQGFRTHADLFRSMTITKSMTYGISEGNHIAGRVHESPGVASNSGSPGL